MSTTSPAAPAPRSWPSAPQQRPEPVPWSRSPRSATTTEVCSHRAVAAGRSSSTSTPMHCSSCPTEPRVGRRSLRSPRPRPTPTATRTPPRAAGRPDRHGPAGRAAPDPPGPAMAYFEAPDHGTIPTDTPSVTRKRLDALTAGDLELARPTGLQRYLANLRSHYPTMPEDATVEIVRFRRTTSDI